MVERNRMSIFILTIIIFFSPISAFAEDPVQPNEKIARLEAQIRALDSAYEAGILTRAEYAEKKADIEARLHAAGSPSLGEAERKKLKALDSAFREGILSREEYEKKKAEIVAVRPAATTILKKGKIYKHPIGFSFGYPEDWEVQVHDDFLQLVPPNPGSSPEGPTELYFIIGESVAGEGIHSPNHPVVISYLNDAVLNISPFLRRKGKPQLMGERNGILLKWEGKNYSNDMVYAHAYCNILCNHGVALIALGLEKPLKSREADLEHMFNSFGFSEGQRDRKLVGVWSLNSTHSIYNDSPFESDWSRAQSVSDTESVLELRANGTWTRTDKSHMLAGAGGVWVESKDSTVNKGKWYAGDCTLYLIWDDNSWSDYDYRLDHTAEGRRLRLVSGKNGESWSAR